MAGHGLLGSNISLQTSNPHCRADILFHDLPSALQVSLDTNSKQIGFMFLLATGICNQCQDAQKSDRSNGQSD